MSSKTKIIFRQMLTISNTYINVILFFVLHMFFINVLFVCLYNFRNNYTYTILQFYAYQK